MIVVVNLFSSGGVVSSLLLPSLQEIMTNVKKRIQRKDFEILIRLYILELLLAKSENKNGIAKNCKSFLDRRVNRFDGHISSYLLFEEEGISFCSGTAHHLLSL